jgi:hypothetical protein
MSELHSRASFSNSNTSGVWGSVYADGTVVSYPYLKWRYQSTPQVVSGTVAGATAGQTVQAAANGSLIGSTATGKNGVYYLLFDNNTIADSTSLLTYVDNGSVKANAVMRSSGTNASSTGLTLADNTVNVSGGSSNTELDVNNLLTTAKGSLTDTDILYTATGTSITVPGDLNVTAAGDLKLGDVTLGTVTAPGSFTLTAGGNISANGAINVGTFDLKGGTWQQVFKDLPAFSAKDFRISGGTFIRALGGDGTSATHYQITDVYGLQGIGSSGMLGNHYTLANNINASGTSSWNGGAGFTPIGNVSTMFTGTFDGGGHTVSGLIIKRSITDDSGNYVGLFGRTSGAVLSNIGLVNASVQGNQYVGGLVGYAGGNSSINNSYAAGSVTGYMNVGGLAGQVEFGSSIDSSYATGTVSGDYTVGGLAGTNSGQINNSYAIASAQSNKGAVGGLVGQNFDTINNSYATGRVTGNTFWTSDIGGLVGMQSSGTITNSYWDTETTGMTTGVGNQANDANSYTGLTTAQMKGAGNFSDWAGIKDTNENNVWYFYDGLTAPLLRSFLTPLTVTVSGNSLTSEYNGKAYSVPDTVTKSIDNAVLSGSLSYGSVINDSYTANTGNAGTYTLGGLYSNQQGYAITYAGATGLTITPKALSATQTAAVTKIYDKDNKATFDM